jgi:outer membrane protein
LAFGDYAVVVLHDGNDNGEVDHNFLGLPTEPLGFSNGFKLGLFSGKPTFEKLRFTFSSKAATP